MVRGFAGFEEGAKFEDVFVGYSNAAAGCREKPA
jgi:hypothetical protein